MHLTHAALLLCVALGQEAAPEAPLLRATSGTARVAETGAVRVLDARTGAYALAGEAARVEAGALATLELVWRGRASAKVTGPAALELEREGRIELESFQSAEVEVRRGTLVLALTGLGTLEIACGALQARRISDGVIELQNRGGPPLVLRRPGLRPLEVLAGERVRLRAVSP